MLFDALLSPDQPKNTRKIINFILKVPSEVMKKTLSTLILMRALLSITDSLVFKHEVKQVNVLLAHIKIKVFIYPKSPILFV